jgi:hypothetical protein
MCLTRRLGRTNTAGCSPRQWGSKRFSERPVRAVRESAPLRQRDVLPRGVGGRPEDRRDGRR